MGENMGEYFLTPQGRENISTPQGGGGYVASLSPPPWPAAQALRHATLGNRVGARRPGALLPTYPEVRAKLVSDPSQLPRAPLPKKTTIERELALNWCGREAARRRGVPGRAPYARAHRSVC